MLEMFALNQSLSKDPVLMDFWYIETSPGASCFEHSLRILFGIPSGPDAFDGLSYFSNFSTPSGLIIIVGIVSSTCFVVFGSVVFCSLVNTDLNWRTCISIALLSFTSCPLVFRGVLFSGFNIFPERLQIVVLKYLHYCIVDVGPFGFPDLSFAFPLEVPVIFRNKKP